MTKWTVVVSILMILLTGCGLTPELVPPTVTALRPSLTQVMPTDIPALPTKAVTPTGTPVPPTHTPLPTSTPIPPTYTPFPTGTPIPPTSTPISPTETLFVTSVPTETPVPGAARTRPTDGMIMVYIPGGEFLRGSADTDRDAEANEKPQRTATVDGFWIDRTEVTVMQFRAFIQATGHSTTAEQKGWAYAYVESAGEWQKVSGADWRHPFGPESEAEDTHPVVQVSRVDAAAYCAWVGGNLPGEAQWEKAARGTDGRLYPWGNDFDGTRLNYCDSRCGGERAFDDGYQYTAPVGSYPTRASPYGVLDMAGNVWEWTTSRMLRGGSWNHDRAGMRAAYRLEASPNTCVDNFGFRCVLQTGTP